MGDRLFRRIGNTLAEGLKRACSHRRSASAALVPERQNFNAVGVGAHPVISVVPHSREVQTANGGERYVSGVCPAVWLEGEKNGGEFEFFADGVGRFRSIEALPIFGGADLRLGEIGDHGSVGSLAAAHLGEEVLE